MALTFFVSWSHLWLPSFDQYSFPLARCLFGCCNLSPSSVELFWLLNLRITSKSMIFLLPMQNFLGMAVLVVVTDSLYSTLFWFWAQAWENVVCTSVGVCSWSRVNSSRYFLPKRFTAYHYFCIAHAFILFHCLWTLLGYVYIGFVQDLTTWLWRVKEEISTHNQWSQSLFWSL